MLLLLLQLLLLLLGSAGSSGAVGAAACAADTAASDASLKGWQKSLPLLSRLDLRSCRGGNEVGDDGLATWWHVSSGLAASPAPLGFALMFRNGGSVTGRKLDTAQESINHASISVARSPHLHRILLLLRRQWRCSRGSRCSRASAGRRKRRISVGARSQ